MLFRRTVKKICEVNAEGSNFKHMILYYCQFLQELLRIQRLFQNHLF